MNTSWTTDISRLLESAFGEPQGTQPFFVISLLAIGSLVLFGWIVVNIVCSAKKGLFVAVFSQVAPAGVAILVWVFLHRYVAPSLESGPVSNLVPIASAITAGFLGSCIITRKLLGVSPSASVVSNLLTYSCVAGMVILGGSLVRQMDSSINGFSEKKNQREIDTQTIMSHDLRPIVLTRN